MICCWAAKGPASQPLRPALGSKAPVLRGSGRTAAPGPFRSCSEQRHARSGGWTQGRAGSRAGCRCCTAALVARQSRLGRLQRRRAWARRQRRAQPGLRSAPGGRPRPSAQTGRAPWAARRQGRCHRRPPAVPAQRRGPSGRVRALRAHACSERRRRRWQTGMWRGRSGAGRRLRRGQRRCRLGGQTCCGRPRAACRHRSLAAWRPRRRTPFRSQPRRASLRRPRALCLRAGQQVLRNEASSGVLLSLHKTGSHLGARGIALL